MQVRLFSHLPVVVGAAISKASGHPLDISAKLYVQGTPATEVAEEDVVSQVPKEQLHQSLLSYEIMLED